MRILIDIGHPSHVHYFSNLISEMKKRQTTFLIIARNKEITFSLLKSYGIDFKSRGNGGKTLIGKLFYIVKADFIIIKHAFRFKPNLLISFGTPYAAHAAKILGKPFIALDDTDVAKLGHLLYVPFSDCIISPVGFKRNFGRKHIFINSTYDILYLNPQKFIPRTSIKKKLGLLANYKTVFVRFTTMNANHDWAHKKFSLNDKFTLVNELKKKYKVLISSEDELPEGLEQHKIQIDPINIHQALFYSDLFIGESGSMSTEAIILGTPSINVAEAALEVGVFKRLVSLNILNIIVDVNDVLDKAEMILNDCNYLSKFNNDREKFLNEVIDPTKFLVWFVENYPLSQKKMLENPKIQYKFKLIGDKDE
jgi:hypothetical protein